MYQGPVSESAFYLWILVLHLHKSSFSVSLVYLPVHECAKSPFHAQGDLGGSSATLGMSSLLNLGTWFPEHCSSKGVDLLGPHWNGPVDKAQGFGQLEGGKCWGLAARQSLLASADSTHSLKGCWPPPALQRYGFSNLPPGQGKGKQYFGEVKSGCEITPFHQTSFSLLWSTLWVFYHLLC